MSEPQPAGSPVSAVLISVSSLDDSLQFYRDALGLTLLDERDWSGPEFEAWWHLPAGSSARTAFLGYGDAPVGRILLLEFSGERRELIRADRKRRMTGLVNLNVYTSDIQADYQRFVDLGFDFWTPPIHQNLGPGVGEYNEVSMEGPDGVVINLVELLTEDPNTFIGGIKAFVEDYGRTPSGYTPVVTTAHGVDSMDQAVQFYRDVLHMQTAMESVLDTPDNNRLFGVREDARTRILFVQGNHDYGKIVLSTPLNYEIDNITDRALPPNIGYFAQSFDVDDLDAAASNCKAVGADVFTPVTDIDLPGRGRHRAMLVRNPGSGALQELVEKA